MKTSPNPETSNLPADRMDPRYRPRRWRKAKPLPPYEEPELPAGVDALGLFAEWRRCRQEEAYDRGEAILARLRALADRPTVSAWDWDPDDLRETARDPQRRRS